VEAFTSFIAPPVLVALFAVKLHPRSTTGAIVTPTESDGAPTASVVASYGSAVVEAMSQSMFGIGPNMAMAPPSSFELDKKVTASKKRGARCAEMAPAAVQGGRVNHSRRRLYGYGLQCVMVIFVTLTERCPKNLNPKLWGPAPQSTTAPPHGAATSRLPGKVAITLDSA